MASHVSEGFASRKFFCLWSSAYLGNEVEQAVEDNHKTILHRLWEKDHFYVEVHVTVEPETVSAEFGSKEKQFSFARLLWSVGAYPVGMLGYLVDTILKIILTVGNFIAFIIALISCDTKWRDGRGIVLLDTFSAAGISIIGIVVPPLAYKLDHMAKESFLNWANPDRARGYETVW